MSNIHGLGAVKKNEPKKDLEEFSQAGAVSGTSVLRPTNSAARGDGDMTKDIVDKARGMVNESKAGGASERNLGAITLYSNGFIVGDGEFRDGNDPKNKAFLDDLKNGIVPEELETVAREQFGDAGAVGVNLVDKSREAYVPPKPKFDFKQSQGQSLGASASAAPVGFANAKPQEVKVDASAPTIVVQVVLSNRQRVKVTLNATHTVLDLYQHIQAISKVKTPFSLMAGFPPKPLTDSSKTVKDAGLAGSSVEQRV